MMGPRALVLAFAAAALAYVALDFVGASEEVALLARDVLQLAAPAAAAVLCARAATRARGIQRAGWSAMSAATGAWALGQVLWTWFEVVLAIDTSRPGWDDAAYYAYYPLAAAAIALLAQSRRVPINTLLSPVADGVLIGGAVLLLAWPLALEEVFAAAGGGGTALFTVGYVMGDIVLVGIALGVIARADRSSRAPPGLMLAGVLLIGIADLGYAVGILGEGYATGAALDTGWLLGPGAIALAALRARPPAPPRRAGAVERVIPLAALAVGVASYGIPMDHPADYAVQGAVFAFTASLAIVRQFAHGREHERLARESAASYARVAHAERIAGIGSWRLDLATRTLDWSENGRGLLRIPPEGPFPTIEQLLAGLEPDVAAKLQGLVERGAAGETPPSVELLVTRMDGARVWMKASSEPERAPDGSIVALRGTMQDIDERKRAQLAAEREQAAREAASQLTRALFDTMPAMIAVWDRSGKLIQWNKELERATGWSGEEVAKRSGADFVVPEQRGLVEAAVQEAFETGSAHLELAILHKDGAARPYMVKGRRFGDPADPMLVAVAVDVEARRRAEAALRRNERLTSLGTLVAGVAHEINNPLTYIRGGVELIEKSVEDLTAAHPEIAKELEDVRADAQTALRGLDRIASITSGLRKIARPPSDKRAEASLNDVVNDILPIAKPRLGPDVVVEMDLRSVARPRFSVEEISQVILNLLINAGDAMREKGGAVRISTRDEGGNTILEIADTGPGIPWEKQAQIFTPFFTTKAEGTGLGLSVSRSIVHDHGGDLTFESTPGRGTTFRLRIPSRATASEVAPR